MNLEGFTRQGARKRAFQTGSQLQMVKRSPEAPHLQFRHSVDGTAGPMRLTCIINCGIVREGSASVDGDVSAP